MPSQLDSPGSAVRTWPWVALITAVGLGLRLFHLDHQSLWSDEMFSIDVSRRPIDALLQALVDDFVHPPLHYFSLHGLFALVGVDAGAARLSSAVMGAVTVPVVYHAAALLLGPKTGVVAALLMAFSQFAITYAQEVRPYAQQLLLVSLALWFFAWSERTRRSGPWWAFVITVTLAIYAHYYSVFFAAPLFLWALLHSPRLPAVRVVLGGAVCAGLLSLWLLSGVVEAWQNSTKTVGEHPFWFDVYATTPFVTLNQFNNGYLDGLFARPPIVVYFIGSALLTAPVCLAVLAVFPRALRWAREPLVWFVVGIGAATLSVVNKGASSGLGLAAVALLRAAQLMVRGRREVPAGRTAFGDAAWALAVVVAGVITAEYGIPRPTQVWASLLGIALGLGLSERLVGFGADVVARRAPILLLALAFAVPFAVPLAMGLLLDVQFDPRYTLAGLPAYCMLAAHGLAWVRVRAVSVAGIVLCVIFSTAALRSNYFVPYKENWRDALQVLADGYRSGDAVVVAPKRSSLPSAWEIYGHAKRHPGVTVLPIEAVTQQVPRYQRVWVLSYRRTTKVGEDSDRIVAQVQKTHREVSTRAFYWIGVGLYERR